MLAKFKERAILYAKVTNELAKLEREVTITMKLAEQIRKHRKENNLTQDQLATELHTTRQTVSKWEQGTIEPNANDCAISATF